MDQIIGHTDVLEFFDNVIRNNRVSHAYCFVGQEHIGRRRVAEEIAAKLLGVTRKQLPVTPDYTFVGQEMNEKTGKTKKDIDIGQMRQLIDRLSLHSFLGGYKVAVIDQAEKLNDSAANALLKTLEEPTAKTIVILLVTDETELPMTIRSRSQMIWFRPIATKDISMALTALDVEPAETDEMARLAHGLPGLALTWVADREVYAAYKAEVLRFGSLIGRSFGEKIQAVEELFESEDDHIAARERWQEILSLWQLLARDGLYFTIEAGIKPVHQLEFGKRWHAALFTEVQNRIIEAKKMLDANIHPRLLVEQILLRIP
jgi:DNA polymerase-3 subunit delta'